MKPEGETSSGGGSKATEQKNKPEPPKDYIHVRARRGQATDRHSLAERVSFFCLDHIVQSLKLVFNNQNWSFDRLGEKRSVRR